MGEVTKLSNATSKHDSLRTTVPFSIVKQFGLKLGDSLDWQIKAEDGNLIIQVTPIRGK
ncbi:MAG: AbrB family transcriptional regulator [Candidatus Bathyarchaeia archaeon]